MNYPAALVMLLPILLIQIGCAPTEATRTEAGGTGFSTEVDEPTGRGLISRVSPDETNVQFRYAFSSDGSVVFFSGYQYNAEDRTCNIWRQEVKGGTLPTKITAGSNDHCYFPAPTKDGKHIVFSSAGKLWKMRSDGVGGRVLIPGSGTDVDYAPTVSTHDVIAFCSLSHTGDSPSSGRTIRSLIWTCTIDGGNLTQLREGSYPQWSPDGSQLVFEYNDDVWLINGDGTNLVQLTNTASIAEGLPSFSPDGKLIVFTSDGGSGTKAYGPEAERPSTNWNIWTMDLNGGNKTQRTTLVSWDSWGTYGPDGLYFLSGRAGKKGKSIQRIWKIRN